MAFPPAVGFHGNVFFRQQIAVRLWVFALDRLPFCINLCIEKIRKLRRGRWFDRPAARTRLILPKDKTSKHQRGAPAREIISHYFPSVSIPAAPDDSQAGFSKSRP